MTIELPFHSKSMPVPQRGGGGNTRSSEAYHTQFPRQLVAEDDTICHMEEINVAAICMWASTLQGCLVHLHMDAMAAALIQLGQSRDAYIQACAHELWLICATTDITLVMSHILGESLTLMADTLNQYHTGIHSFRILFTI